MPERAQIYVMAVVSVSQDVVSDIRTVAMVVIFLVPTWMTIAIPQEQLNTFPWWNGVNQ